MSSQTPVARVLLAEDDDDLRVTTRLVLERHGFEVDTAADGTEAETKLTIGDYDVAVLDVVMPGRDGIWLTRNVAADRRIPVVLLTARDLVSDEIAGLEAGADDYVTKPFDGDVLVARLKAAIRRTAVARAVTDRVGDLEIDREGMVVDRAGERLHLTATEFRLLATLLDHAGMVLSRAQLLDRVWGSSEWGDPRVVDVNIQRLRTKLGADLIQTVRGAGYKLVRP